MSNHVDKGKQPMYPYQYVWVPHWPVLDEKNQLSNFVGHHGYDPRINQWPVQKNKEITSHISGSVKQCVKDNAIDFGILKNDQEMNSRNQRRDRPAFFDSITNISQESQPTSNGEYVSSLLSLAPPGTESSCMGSHIQHQSVSQCPTELVASHKIFGSNLGFSAPLPKDIRGTSSRVSPQIFGLGEENFGCATTPTAPSFQFRVEENDNHVRSITPSKRKLSVTNILKVGEHEKCNDSSGVLSDNLSGRNNLPPAFREEQYNKMNNFSSINMFSTSAPEANTMRIQTPANDLGGFTPICYANHTFPVMGSTDTNLQKKDGNRDSKVVTQMQENVPNRCYSVPQPIGHGKQVLLMSSDSEGNDDVNDVRATEVVSKNAAAETHTVDMNIFKEKHVIGVPSSSSKKDVSANMDSPHPNLVTGTPGVRVQSQKHPIPEIPDMNIPLNVELGGASVVHNADPSTSKTRSLDMDYVPEQSSNWIKRLKISEPCNHSVGTRSLRLDETTTNKEANQFVSKGVGGETSISEPVPVSTAKELMTVNKEKTPLRDVDPSSNDNADESDGTNRILYWIQRWRKPPTATPKNSSEPAVICDPQTSKASFDELDKKPLLSIAAMALLGKGYSDVKCQYRNEGNYTVWES